MKLKKEILKYCRNSSNLWFEIIRFEDCKETVPAPAAVTYTIRLNTANDKARYHVTIMPNYVMLSCHLDVH